jgi:hypothetical protein
MKAKVTGDEKSITEETYCNYGKLYSMSADNIGNVFYMNKISSPSLVLQHETSAASAIH